MVKVKNFRSTVAAEFCNLDKHWTYVFNSLMKYLYVNSEMRHLRTALDDYKICMVAFRQAFEL